MSKIYIVTAKIQIFKYVVRTLFEHGIITDINSVKIISCFDDIRARLNKDSKVINLEDNYRVKEIFEIDRYIKAKEVTPFCFNSRNTTELDELKKYLNK